MNERGEMNTNCMKHFNKDQIKERPHQLIYGRGCTGGPGRQERMAEGGQDKVNGCQSRVAFSLHHQCRTGATLLVYNVLFCYVRSLHFAHVSPLVGELIGQNFELA